MAPDGSVRDTRRTAAAALATDLACILVFAASGRRSHSEALSIAGLAETSWPFLTGTLVGWLVSRGWRRPHSLAPTGVVVWLCTVVVGMALRKASSAGTALSFVIVTTLVTAALLLGWRATLAALARYRAR